MTHHMHTSAQAQISVNQPKTELRIKSEPDQSHFTNTEVTIETEKSTLLDEIAAEIESPEKLSLVKSALDTKSKTIDRGLKELPNSVRKSMKKQKKYGKLPPDLRDKLTPPDKVESRSTFERQMRQELCTEIKETLKKPQRCHKRKLREKVIQHRVIQKYSTIGKFVNVKRMLKDYLQGGKNFASKELLSKKFETFQELSKITKVSVSGLQKYMAKLSTRPPTKEDEERW